MRALTILLGLLLAVLMAGGAAAQSATERQQATPQWDIKAYRTREGGVHCYYYKPGTLVREERLRGPEEQRARRFQKVEKFQFNQQLRAFRGEPVVREEPLREVSVFTAPKPLQEAGKWNFFRTPTRLPEKYGPPVSLEEMGRGAAKLGPPQRPPTYIAEAQQAARDFRHFETVDECLYVRSEFPSPLQQVVNRQASPQWHF